MGSKILKMQVENLKIVSCAEITMNGELHQVCGDSNKGKTTILEAIAGAIKGIPKEMIRLGQDRATLEIRLSDAHIKRIVSKSEDVKDVLLVNDGNGKAIKEANAFLKAISGAASFRPVAWVNLGGGDAKGRTERLREQRNQLVQSLNVTLPPEAVAEAVQAMGSVYADALGEVNLDGVDFDAHPFSVCGGLHDACYAFRKLQNERLEQAEEDLRHRLAPDREAPAESVEVLEAAWRRAMERYHQAIGRNGNQENMLQRKRDLEAAIERFRRTTPAVADVQARKAHFEEQATNARAEIERLRLLIKEQDRLFAEAETELQQVRQDESLIQTQAARIADLKALTEEMSGATDFEDTDALLAEANRIEQAKADRVAQDAHNEAAARASAAAERAEIFEELVKLFRDELPKRLLQEANLNIPGLAVTADAILIDGHPLHQLGTGRAIQIGVRLFHQLYPDCGFLCVDQGECLGREGMIALREIAEELDLQLIITVVDPDAEPSEGVTVMEGGKPKKMKGAA